MNLLTTVGFGFIGSNCMSSYLKSNPEIKIVNLDKLTYSGGVSNLEEVSNNNNYTFVEGEVCNRVLVENLFKQLNSDGVIPFAAEPHVDHSIKNPGTFITTNITGTFNLLDMAKSFWMEGVNEFKKEFEQGRFHHLSTDEVYGTLGETELFTEDTPYAPNSPYSV